MAITKVVARRMLKEVGAKRISDSAALEFAEVLNSLAYSIAKKAVKLAAHAKRSTIMKEDVELAK